jgi:hypothetical protein
MKISLITTHREVVGILQENRLTPPPIPAGCNTLLWPCTIDNGFPAILINQTGFSPTAQDNEEELNGYSLLVGHCEDSPEARATLETFAAKILKE